MRGVFIVAVTLLCVASMAANAHAVSFGLNSEYSGGAQPQGTSPWLEATFEDIAADTVKLIMDASNLIGSEFVGSWYFNLADQFVTSLSLRISPISGPIASSTPRGLNAFRAGNNLGDGFDLLFDFPQREGERFGSGDVSIYEISDSGLTAEAFNELNQPKNGTGTFYSAAHVQSISVEPGSGWIAAGDSKAMPEPTTLLSLGLGMLGLGLVARKRFSR